MSFRSAARACSPAQSRSMALRPKIPERSRLALGDSGSCCSASRSRFRSSRCPGLICCARRAARAQRAETPSQRPSQPICSTTFALAACQSSPCAAVSSTLEKTSVIESRVLESIPASRSRIVSVAPRGSTNKKDRSAVASTCSVIQRWRGLTWPSPGRSIHSTPDFAQGLSRNTTTRCQTSGSSRIMASPQPSSERTG